MLGVTQKQTLTLTASDLEGNITITCPATITCDKTVITKEEAMAEGGVQLVFAVTPDKAGEYDEKVTLRPREPRMWMYRSPSAKLRML